MVPNNVYYYNAYCFKVRRIQLPPLGVLADPMQAPARAFDSSQELFWTGDELGRVKSFYALDGQRYTSYKAGQDPIRQFLFHDRGVISVGGRSVHMASRRGLYIWHITHEDMKDLRCMSYTSRGTSEILVAGLQNQMFVIDVDKGIITKQIRTSDHFKIMKRSRYICAATPTGSVTILDSLNFTVVKIWQAHTALINDMDAQSDYVVTCGYSLSLQGSYRLDTFVLVLNLRTLTTLAPIPFPPGAAFVRMHPRMLTTSYIVSQQGQIHICDLINPNSSNVRQANVLSTLRSLEIASSGEAIALSDMENSIHIWGSPGRIRFAEFSNPVEFADSDEKSVRTNWTDDTPLSTVGMPYYRETLLSAWPSHMVFEVGAPPVKVDPSSISSPKALDWYICGHNTRREVRRNQIENTRITGKTPASIQAPKFLSEKAREAVNDATPERGMNDIADTIGNKELPTLQAGTNALYMNVEIKYSKFGVDDFDFGFYNKTSYSGLETHISNSYANALLQVMRFTTLIRNLALQHTATNCVNDMCLLCEMGFLFDMLEKAAGTVCQATNLLKTFSHHPEAKHLGLLEEESRGVPLSNMLQSMNRFFLERIPNEYKSIPPGSTLLEHVFSTPATMIIKCVFCKSEHTRPGATSSVDLIYPPAPLKLYNRNGKTPMPKRSLSEILKASIERETTNRGWCMNCKKYQSLQTKKTIHSSPHILMLNACISTPESKHFWETPGCLPEEIGIIISQGQIFCYQGEDLRLHIQRGAHNITVYSLVGLAADIDIGQHEKPHLVSLINVSHSAPIAPAESRWFLFNDFLVTPMPKEDALSFSSSWKLPSVITYQVKDENNRVDNSWKQNLDTSLLFANENTRVIDKTHKPLSNRERPTEGTLIALDTEFVSIRQPEIEVNSEGERQTIRPIAHALARVSVVRGSGDNEGFPFIDDYINCKDTIVDYLTSYSGINPGDLDPRQSKHNLVSLKIAYKKLWILLNLGCKFVGHGLKTDFRVINIQIPKSHVIDTADLFFIPAKQRKLGLAFLAWYLFREDIQIETHDSIEDARTALRLWRKWEEWIASEELGGALMEDLLIEVYKAGQASNFRPPGFNARKEREREREREGKDISRANTPPGSNEDGGVSLKGPSTPVRKPLRVLPFGSGGSGSANGSGLSSFGGGGGGWTPGKGSPLR
ncbi:hypothetical protein SBOR_5290 [Sclerotinia borealis F-4128]|uniref:PAN2-PAN3 deadenylation complex catalytic subunit PAN2 n=1 Tax=Sclerotinia borealis (strain F-4128) TaxID=1432307 RepID=W9CI04_SCLBF|nr:hypothetical protein SBOR_5290 [Sclerotinia borealis F-4128]